MYLAARFFLIVACFCLTAAPVAANPFPRAASAYLVKTGNTTVWSHRAYKRLPPASLTKIMTALIVLERARFDDVVTVSAAAAAETGSRIKLKMGERLLVKDLLAAMLVNSANDAAHALADHIAGSEAKFAQLMNRRAATLGLINTHFVNAAGHDHPKHYSTAGDLARLTEYVLTFATFQELVGLPDMEIRTVDGLRSYTLRNTNRLLGNYEGMIGVKTGFTSKAGPCLVAVVERDGERVLLVMLNSPTRWKSAAHILDQAMAKVEARTRPRLAAHLPREVRSLP
jgi:D-alanyl-D-alanine carboxypeptidase (penicillin-binding protein 5/6)